MLLNLTENESFSFLQEAFCRLEYAENAFGETGETHGALPNPIVGWERTPLPNRQPTKEKGRNLSVLRQNIAYRICSKCLS